MRHVRKECCNIMCCICSTMTCSPMRKLAHRGAGAGGDAAVLSGEHAVVAGRGQAFGAKVGAVAVDARHDWGGASVEPPVCGQIRSAMSKSILICERFECKLACNCVHMRSGMQQHRAEQHRAEQSRLTRVIAAGLVTSGCDVGQVAADVRGRVDERARCSATCRHRQKNKVRI